MNELVSITLGSAQKSYFPARIRWWVLAVLVVIGGPLVGQDQDDGRQADREQDRRVLEIGDALPLADPLADHSGWPHPEFAAELPAVPDSPLDQFLERHRLEGLREARLRRAVASASERNEQLAAARHLADFYIQQQRSDPASDAESKLTALLNRFPELDSPQILLARWEAQYRNLRNRFHEWIDQRRNPQIQSELKSSWKQLLDELDSQRVVAEQRVQETGFRGGGRQWSALHHQLLYLIAWGEYYYGLQIDELDERLARFQRSADYFRQLLRLDIDQSLEQLPDDWLDLESGWNARCLLGLAMAWQAAGADELAELGFDRLAGEQVPALIRRELPAWRFRSFYYPGAIDRAATFAVQMYRDSSPMSPNRLPLGEWLDDSWWVSLVVAGQVWPEPHADSAKRISLAGLAGLARSGQFQLLAELIERHRIQLLHDSFYTSWIGAHLAWMRYESRGDADDLSRAAELIDRALAQAGGIDDPLAIAQAAWLRGMTAYRLQRLEVAADSFFRVGQLLRNHQPERAARALSMRVQVLHRLASDEPRWHDEFITAVEQLKQWFPNSRFARLADYQLRRPNWVALEPAETIQRLQTVSPSDTNYALARWDIAHARFRHWRTLYEQWNTFAAELTSPLTEPVQPSHASERSGSDEPGDLAAQLERALRELEREVEWYLEAVSAADNAQRLSCGLLFVDAALRSQPPRLDEAASWLTRLQSLADSLSDHQSEKGNFYYQNLRLAELDSRQGLAESSAQWLRRHAATITWKNAGLAWLIDDLEDQIDWEIVEPTSDNRQLIKLARLYRELIDNGRSEGQGLQEHGNLRVAWFRWAELQWMLGNAEAAVEPVSELLQYAPREANYLLLAARVDQALGQHGQALETWRLLAAGTPIGSPLWLEAKYNTAEILRRSDRQHAQRVLRQTVQLAGIMPDPWPQRFQQLEQRLDRGVDR